MGSSNYSTTPRPELHHPLFLDRPVYTAFIAEGGITAFAALEPMAAHAAPGGWYIHSGARKLNGHRWGRRQWQRACQLRLACHDELAAAARAEGWREERIWQPEMLGSHDFGCEVTVWFPPAHRALAQAAATAAPRLPLWQQTRHNPQAGYWFGYARHGGPQAAPVARLSIALSPTSGLYAWYVELLGAARSSRIEQGCMEFDSGLALDALQAEGRAVAALARLLVTETPYM
jgi:hypothetical protein